jgi:hypothetical protein
VAGDMILKDPWVVDWVGTLLNSLQHVGPLSIGFLVAFLGWWWVRGTAAKDERRMADD